MKHITFGTARTHKRRHRLAAHTGLNSVDIQGEDAVPPVPKLAKEYPKLRSKSFSASDSCTDDVETRPKSLSNSFSLQGKSFLRTENAFPFACPIFSEATSAIRLPRKSSVAFPERFVDPLPKVETKWDMGLTMGCAVPTDCPFQQKQRSSTPKCSMHYSQLSTTDPQNQRNG